MKRANLKIFIFCLLCFYLNGCGSSSSSSSGEGSSEGAGEGQPETQEGMTGSISQYGITWTFSEPVKYGQFATGDYWVVGPVTITQITPASTIVSENWADPPFGVVDRVINGSMINPDPKLGELQGYDSQMYRYPLDYGQEYDADLNVARPNGNNLSVANPLNVSAGSSLISSISHTYAELVEQNTKVFIKSAAVLTVLAEEPPESSFRPPYCGTDKTVSWQIDDLDYSVLANLEPVDYTPEPPEL